MGKVEFEVSRTSQPYWDCVARSEFQIPWCLSCGAPHFPPRAFCPECWSDDLEWRTTSGRATLISYTRVEANAPTAFRDMVPFVMAIVRLEEGPQLLTHIVGDTSSLECDAPLMLDWAVVAERRLPVFRIA